MSIISIYYLSSKKTGIIFFYLENNTYICGKYML